MPSRSITARERALAGDGEGDDLGQIEPLEAEPECGAGRFGGQAVAPVGAGEPPADLDGGGEGGREGHGLQADKPDEVRLPRHFDRP